MSARRQLPWSGACFVCGEDNPNGLDVRFVVERDGVRVDTVLDPAFEGYPGRVHGGVISALLDETIGWACSVASHRLHLTVELRVRYRGAVPAGVPIVVHGRVDRITTRIADGHGWIEDSTGTILASAEGRFHPVPREVHHDVVSMLRMPGRPATADDI